MPSRDPLPLDPDGRALGLRRLRVPTRLGEVSVRIGPMGPGPALVLLHGAAGSWTTWTPLIRAAEDSGRALTGVVAIDLPGWGESAEAPDARTVEDLSDAVVDALQHLGLASWHLVGHSLGGFVALDIAARHAENTHAVTLVSPTGPAVLDAVRRPLRGGARLPWFAGMLVAMRVLGSLGGVGTALVAGLGRLGALPALTSPLFAAPVDRTVADAFGSEVRPGSFARAAHLAGRYEERTWALIAAPVRSVRGERDVFSGADDGIRLGALIRDFHEHRVGAAGHFAHIESPDAVLNALRASDRAATPVSATGAATP